MSNIFFLSHERLVGAPVRFGNNSLSLGANSFFSRISLLVCVLSFHLVWSLEYFHIVVWRVLKTHILFLSLKCLLESTWEVAYLYFNFII